MPGKVEGMFAVLRIREKELLDILGPCETEPLCRLHKDHKGTCDIRRDHKKPATKASDWKTRRVNGLN